MKTNRLSQAPAVVFLQTVSVALAQLKQRLQQDYEQAYPDLGQIIRIVLDEEEARAWELTLFPHLLLPDMVEAHLACLNLQPVGTKHHARTAGIPNLSTSFCDMRLAETSRCKVNTTILRNNGHGRSTPQVAQQATL